MSIKEDHNRMVEDLKTLKAYFEMRTQGSSPACLEYAIEVLEGLGKVEIEGEDKK